MAAIYLPERNIAVLLVPGCAVDALKGVVPATNAGVPADRFGLVGTVPEESRLLAVIRDPLERFQEFHRINWIENRSPALPDALRRVGFQRDWPVALVAGHAASLALANMQSPGLVPFGGYSPQSALWGDTRPEFLLFDNLAYEWSNKVGVEPIPQVDDTKYRYSPAAIIGELKHTLERAYAVDIAVYAQAKRRADEEFDRLRSLMPKVALP